MSEPSRRAWTAELMGTTASIHVIGSPDACAAATDAAASTVAMLRELEAIFSTYRADSEISRLRRGELSFADADPRLTDVADACRRLEEATGGRFSAFWRERFDPTGYVKGWATDVAATAHLEPLLAMPGVSAVGINVGGDLRVWTAPGAPWSWTVGIADPVRPGAALATLRVRNGAVATSGTAERGAHLVDPRSGIAVSAAVSATVVADDLTTADVWATALAVAAGEDTRWLWDAPLRSAMTVTDAGVRRWVAGVGVETVAATAA